jgi:hypothetical protein
MLLIFLRVDVSARDTFTVTQLKDLHLTTSIVEEGMSQAVIVAPVGDRYQAEIDTLNERIRLLTGTTLPVFRDDKTPEELLREYNVVVLGNMATNAFIETLYRQWQVILDLKYPGAGGYVVRSLHNPYATGHNVIFLGGSDDAGVSEAVQVFAEGLTGGSSLKIDRLMKIKLGTAFSLPVIGADLSKWDVQSWNDSWRKTSTTRETGYPASTYFGWNPISIAGMFYYMTGETKYLDLFKKLALTAPGNVPLVISASDAFTDPSNPLVKNDHYRSHLMDCIYDLIEESQNFSDEERLLITNKLIEHQFELDPDGTYSRPLGDRHATWNMLCIYTGSRYLARYYPSELWERRLANVRKGFASFNVDPTWGVQEDTLNWVATFIEPILDFALLDNPLEFVNSGAARVYMQGLEALMTGDEIDDFNYFLPHNLLFKAAWLLKDSHYTWMANQLGVNFSKFRIGQSYWPVNSTPAMPVREPSSNVMVAPLSNIDWKTINTTVPYNQSFQVLSFRNGLDKNDDLLLLDGFAGTGRHPFQLNTLLRLRMFSGKNILYGNSNDLNVWPNGMSSSLVAKSAAIKEKVSAGNFAFIHTEVPDMPGAKWQRRIVYLKNRHAVVVDSVVAREKSWFDLLSSWEFGGGVNLAGKASNRVVVSNGTVLVSANIPYEQLSTTIVQGRISRNLGQGESIDLANLFFDNLDPKSISTLRNGGYLVSGNSSGFVGTGPASYSTFSVVADFCYLDNDKLFIENGTKLVVNGRIIFSSNIPITMFWDLRENSGTFSAMQTATVQLADDKGLNETIINAGQVMDFKTASSTELMVQLSGALLNLNQEKITSIPIIKNIAEPSASWLPVWEHTFNGKVTLISKTLNSNSGEIWAISQDTQAATINCIDSNGDIKRTIQQSGEIFSVWPANNERQSQAFALLAGFKDDTLRAYTVDGNELWAVKAAIHPSFLVGDHYYAPWFTDPAPPYNMTGVFSLVVDDFWGTGNDQIALGRPSTVEFRSLDGQLVASIPTQWGNNTSLAVLKNGGNGGTEPLVLVGKGYTGNPTLSGINRDYTNISDNMFGGLLPGVTNMHSWLMRGLASLRVADINGDSIEELMYTLSGHWNELRVYNPSGTPLWLKSFGPDMNTSALFMTGLELLDFDKNGRKEIVVGTRLGWLTVFDDMGTQIWQHHFESGISKISVSNNQKIAVGCDDGSLILLDGDGKQLVTSQMGGAITSVFFDEDAVIAGNANGLVRRYAIPH